MYVEFGIENYASTGDGVWSVVSSDINSVKDVGVSLSLGDLNDVFTMKVYNTRNEQVGVFTQQDNIKIHYLINTSSLDSSNLIFNGLVKTVDSESSYKGKFLTVKGGSFDEITANGLVFYTNTNVDVMQFLRGCLNSITIRNGSFGVVWDETNPSVKSDGVTPFPKLNGGGKVKEFDKSFNSILERYLQDSYTKDGQYYWYISSDKKLVVRPKDSVINGSLVEGVDFSSDQIKIGDDIFNYVVVKCGFDPNGNPITSRYVDEISKAKHGFKPYIITDANIAGVLLEAEKDNPLFNDETQKPGTYPYTVSWKTEAGNAITVSNDSGYVAAFRAKAKLEGSNRGKSFATSHIEGFKTARITFKPTLKYSVGGKYLLTVPSYGLSEFPMRIKEIIYSIKNVIITFEEEIVV